MEHSSDTMGTVNVSCEACKEVKERPDLPHVVRLCPACGRELRIHEPGLHGIGFKVQKGDQVVLPSGLFKLSLNPLKSTVNFSKYGLQMHAAKLHFEDIFNKREEIPTEIENLEAQCSQILEQSPLLVGLNLSDEKDCDKIYKILEAHNGSVEWFAFTMGMFISFLREAMETNNTNMAIWAMGCVERSRSMLIYKQHLEEVVWMGHSAKRVVDILRVWDQNKANDDEGFWQHVFAANVYALSQVFAVPLVFIRQSAYVGGMTIDQKNGKLADYLFSKEFSHEAVLIEIKTPATKLLGAKYRGTYRPSSELSGAVMQGLDYRRSLTKNLGQLTNDTKHDLTAFEPRCAVIIGNGSAELIDSTRRDAFEMFRANSKDVQIVTYDELFRKLEVLASLFSLSRPPP